MDGIGQIVGLWSVMNNTPILPCAAEKIEFYQPTPPVGTRAPVRMECLQISQDTRQIRCNVEIRDPQGNPWVSVKGWTEWLMSWTMQYLDMTRLPGWFLLSDELPLPGLPEGSVCMQLDREHLATPDADWVTRIFMAEIERPEFNGIS